MCACLSVFCFSSFFFFFFFQVGFRIQKAQLSVLLLPSFLVFFFCICLCSRFSFSLTTSTNERKQHTQQQKKKKLSQLNSEDVRKPSK